MSVCNDFWIPRQPHIAQNPSEIASQSGYHIHVTCLWCGIAQVSLRSCPGCYCTSCSLATKLLVEGISFRRRHGSGESFSEMIWIHRPWKSRNPSVFRPNERMQGVQARYDAGLPSFISIVRHPGHPVMSGMKGNDCRMPWGWRYDVALHPTHRHRHIVTQLLRTHWCSANKRGVVALTLPTLQGLRADIVPTIQVPPHTTPSLIKSCLTTRPLDWVRAKALHKRRLRYWGLKTRARNGKRCCKNQCSRSRAVNRSVWTPCCMILWGWLMDASCWETGPLWIVRLNSTTCSLLKLAVLVLFDPAGLVHCADEPAFLQRWKAHECCTSC